MELVRMRTQLDRVYFIFSFVLYPHVNEIAGENVTLEQEVVVFGQGGQGFLQRSGCGFGIGVKSPFDLSYWIC